jgi:hypothetical protein
MSIQDVKVTNLTNWATETTLKRLVYITEKQFDIKSDGFEELNDAAKKGGKSATGLADGLDKATKGTRSYEQAVWDLQRGTERYNRRLNSSMDALKGQSTLASMMTNTASRIQVLGSSLSAFGQMLPGRLGMAARGAGALTVIAGGVAAAGAAIGGRFIEAGETFRSMIETGVIFDGTVSGMIQSVRRTGMSLDSASQLIQSHSEAILVTGEQRFFNTVDAMANTFSKMGLDATRGAEALANLTEIQRLNGSLFVMSEQQRIQANTTLLQQMDAQRRLTGISLRRQQEEQATLNRREKVRVLKAGLTPEQLAAVNAQESAMLNMGMRPELVEAALLEAFEGYGTKEGGMARNVYGPEYARIIQQLRTGETIGGIEQIEAFRARGQEALTGSQRGIALMSESPYGQFLRSQVLLGLERGQAATQAPPGQEADVARRQEQAARALEGQSMLHRSTVDLYTTQDQIAKTFGTLDGLLMTKVQPAVDLFLQGTSAAATATLDMARRLEGGGLDAILAGLLTTLGPEGLAALAAGGAATAATRSTTNAPGGAATPPPPTSGLPPAVVGFGMGAARLASNVLGIEQLISAYTAYSQGNYGEMAAHLGLAAARKNPFGMAMSLIDFATELGTGKGIVSRAADMIGGRSTPEERAAQESIQAAAAAQLSASGRAPMPAIPATGSLTPEQRVALDAQIQTIVTRIGELQASGADARNRELLELQRESNELQRRLLNEIRGVRSNQ